MASWSEPPGNGDPVADMFDRMIAGERTAVQDVARAREYAERLLRRLLPLETSQRRFLLANVPEEMLRACSLRLRDEARARRRTRPEETLELTESAVSLAEQIAEGGHLVLVEALTERGNARRLVGDLDGAEKDFSVAGRLLGDHGVDALAEADLLSTRASLAKARRRFAEAIELAGHSCTLYADCGQVSGALSSLIQLGTLHGHAGQHEEGINILGGALELAVDLGTAEDLLHVANNIAFLFAEAGLTTDALALVDRAREFSDEVGTRHDGLRLDWLAARLQADLGHHSAAAILLADLRAAYREEGMPYETALLSLDLALAFARLGRRVELRYLAEETAEAFRLLGVEREAIGALTLLARADAEEAAELTARMAAAVRRARRPGEN